MWIEPLQMLFVLETVRLQTNIFQIVSNYAV